MQVRCIRPFGDAVVGAVREVPDGAEVDPVHWEPVVSPVAITLTGAAEALAKIGEVQAKGSELAPLIPAKEEMLWHRLRAWPASGGSSMR